MRLALSSYSFTWAVGVPGQIPSTPMTWEDLIGEALRMEVSCVQIADNMPLHRLSATEQQKLKDFALNNQISIEIGARGLKPDKFHIYIHLAEFFGSPVLRYVIDEPDFLPTIPEVVSIVNDALPLLKEKKVILALENHDRFLARQFRDIVLQTDPQWVGICLDTVNSLGAAEGIESVAEILLPFTVNLHIKDFSIRRLEHKMGLLVEGTPAGKGMLNIPWLLNKVVKGGRCQTAVLELWTPPEQDLQLTIEKEKQWVEESIRFLKPLIL